MKKNVVVYLLLVIAIVLNACNSGNNSSQNNVNKIKVGIVLPLTGDLANYGVDAKNGIDYAYLKLGKDTAKYELIFEDTKAETKSAVMAINKLVEIDKVNFIIGDLLSNTCLAMAPIANENQVLMISPTASSSELRTQGKYFISIYPSEIEEGKVLAQIAEKNKFDKIGIVYEKVAAAQSMSESFTKNLKSSSTVLITEGISSDNKDFRVLIQKFRQKNINCLLIITYTEPAKYLLSQIKEQKWNINILSQSALYDQGFIDGTGKNSEGMILTGSYFTEMRQDTLISSFVKEFALKYGVKPNMFAAQSFDAFNFGVQINNSQKGDIPQTIINSNFTGITGKLVFDNNLSVNKKFSVLRVINGTFSLIE